MQHTGAGSILAALRGPALLPSTHPPRLIIVPNDSLMDNHQEELARAIADSRWAIVSRPEPE